MFKAFRCVVLAAILGVFGGAPAQAHEGHDHGSEPAPVAGVAPRAEAVSDTFELVAVAGHEALSIYLDRFKSNEPVSGADITVETPDGSVKAEPAGNGTYTLKAPWAERAGRYDLIFTVSADGTADVLAASLEIGAASLGEAARAPANFSRWPTSEPLSIALLAGFGGMLVGACLTAWLGRRRSGATVAVLALITLGFGAHADAHEGHDHDAPAQSAGPREAAQRASDGSLFVPKSTQRLLGIRTDVVASAAYRRTIELPGRIIPDPNASGLVQASAGGRLSPPPGGFPRLGTRVSKGDVVAYVTPPLQSIDRSDMRQRQGELDQQIKIVERRIARFEPLVEGGAVTRVQLEEARLELQGLKDRRAALDEARGEPEALTAPVSGVIADVNAVAGQMAQPNTVLFQIVEPARMWVEALSFDVLSTVERASAKVGPTRQLALTWAGAGLADRNQAIPVHFKIEDDPGGLRVGQFLTVLATTDEQREGVALPRASVVRTQTGQDVVFEHTAAERFEPRLVRVEPLDGDRVLVLAGIGSGVRIVVQGAELLEQIR